LEHISPNDVTHRPNVKESLGGTTSFEPLSVNIGRAVRAGLRTTKIEDSTGQEKSHKGYTSPIYGEACTEAMYIKNCLVGDVLGIITCVKFQNEIFRGYDFTGVELSIFLLIFEWAFQHCSATELCIG